MANRKQLEALRKAEENRREAAKKMQERRSVLVSAKIPPPQTASSDDAISTAAALGVDKPAASHASTEQARMAGAGYTPTPSSTGIAAVPVVARVGRALLPIYRDDTTEASTPAAAFIGLADLYLSAAENRSRHIALVWPTEIRTLAIVHALATLARWNEGDKLGVRGGIFPAKSNVFHPLNHMYLDRSELFRRAQSMNEVQPNERVKRSCPDKDAFLFALGDRSLSAVPGEPLHPAVASFFLTSTASQGSLVGRLATTNC